jgi:hypothetical protein
MGTVLTSQISIHEEINSRLKSECCHFSAEHFFCQFTAQKYEEYDISNCNFDFFFCGCVTWLLIQRVECSRLRVFENRVMWRILWPKRD